MASLQLDADPLIYFVKLVQSTIGAKKPRYGRGFVGLRAPECRCSLYGWAAE